jgi:hypothetical protein
LTFSWNLGKVEEIGDNQAKLFEQAGILEEPAEIGEFDDKFTCMYNRV